MVRAGLELYNLKNDVAETKNIVDQHPEVMKQMLDLATKARNDLGDRLTKTPPTNNRQPGLLKK